jgi:hypothetical protein
MIQKIFFHDIIAKVMLISNCCIKEIYRIVTRILSSIYAASLIFIAVFLLIGNQRLFSIQPSDTFVTVWKPNNPSDTIPEKQLSRANQVWFPGVGNGYLIEWEEIGFPEHNGVIKNVVSTVGKPVLINFGTTRNSDLSEVAYRVKVSDGSGNFNQIQFCNLEAKNPKTYRIGDTQKISDIEQWGKVKWQSMFYAFSCCKNMNITATDKPDLNLVSDMTGMFYLCDSIKINNSIRNWNLSTIIDTSDSIRIKELSQDAVTTLQFYKIQEKEWANALRINNIEKRMITYYKQNRKSQTFYYLSVGLSVISLGLQYSGKVDRAIPLTLGLGSGILGITGAVIAIDSYKYMNIRR